MIKQNFKNIIRSLGYEIHKSGVCTDPNCLSIGDQNVFPQVLSYNISGNQFKFWVISSEIKNTYDPEVIKRDMEVIELIKLVSPGERVLEVGSNPWLFHCVVVKTCRGKWICIRS